MEDEYTEISTDSATDLVRRVRTHNGTRLEMRSLQAGSQVRLDALLLESLSWQSPEKLSEGLEEPYGPAEAAH